MKNFYNIEKSENPDKQYVGYSAGSVWQIYGQSGNWSARKVVGPIVGKTKLLVGFDTLAEISAELTKLESEGEE